MACSVSVYSIAVCFLTLTVDLGRKAYQNSKRKGRRNQHGFSIRCLCVKKLAINDLRALARWVGCQSLLIRRFSHIVHFIINRKQLFKNSDSRLNLLAFHQTPVAMESAGRQEQQQPPTNRLKGILALLPGTVEHLGCTMEIADVIGVNHDDDDVQVVVAVLLVDARQALSQKLLRKLGSIQRDNNGSHQFRLFICNQRPDVPLPDQSSCYLLPHLGTAGPLLGFHSCPGLAVLAVATGRKFSHAQEELGVLWNTPAAILQAWRDEQATCLTPLQRVQAGVLFPTMCTIQ
jgi:hypothetical protein